MSIAAKHAHSSDPAARRARVLTLVVVWLAGLGVGFVGIVATFARYGCSESATGLGCRSTGTVVGTLVIIGVIAIVTAVTAFTHERPARNVITAGAFAVVGLGLLFLAAEGLLSTI
ncbi:MAG: hypothetical protein ABI345_08920 [Jatrophihabitans sp.]